MEPRGITLESVVPWGRSLREYRQMFALTDEAMAGLRVLDCAGGPASFCAEATACGAFAVAVDPIYKFPPEDLRHRIDETAAIVVDGVRRNRGGYHWDDIPTPEALGEARLAAMGDFLADFHSVSARGRYVAGQFPTLPFTDDSFDLCLCSHLLFTYSMQLDEALHAAAIREMLRVAPEVRVFPTISLDCSPSPHLQPVCARLAWEGHQVLFQRSAYRLQRGADVRLVIRRRRDG